MTDYNAPLGDDAFVIDLPGAIVHLEVDEQMPGIVFINSAREIKLDKTFMDRLRRHRVVRWKHDGSRQGAITVSNTGDAIASGPGSFANSGVHIGGQTVQSATNGGVVTVTLPNTYTLIVVKAANTWIAPPEVMQTIQDQR